MDSARFYTQLQPGQGRLVPKPPRHTSRSVLTTCANPKWVVDSDAGPQGPAADRLFQARSSDGTDQARRRAGPKAG